MKIDESGSRDFILDSFKTRVTPMDQQAGMTICSILSTTVIPKLVKVDDGQIHKSWL